jgi:hypothetical protein
MKERARLVLHFRVEDVIFLKKKISWALVTHCCNPGYSGGRDQEDCGSKPAQANSSLDPISKIPNTKRSGRVAQGEGPEFKPLYYQKVK